MKLGEYIKKNDIKKISVATSVDDLVNRVEFLDINMIPVKYWDADVRTFRHKLNMECGSIKDIEVIAIVKFT